jgi:hypothetical protein
VHRTIFLIQRDIFTLKLFPIQVLSKMPKHEKEHKRPILLEQRCSNLFVIFVVSFATFTVGLQKRIEPLKRPC